MDIPITQSEEWQKLQNDLAETSFFEKEKDYQCLAILTKRPGGNYLYLPYGPVADTEQGFRKALDSLRRLAKTHNAIFVRVEPINPEFSKILPSTAKKTKDISPKDTWVLDLTPDIPTLLTNFFLLENDYFL